VNREDRTPGLAARPLSSRSSPLILVGLMHGIDRDEVLQSNWEPLQRMRAHQPLHPQIDEVAAGSFRRRSPPEIVGRGYVVKSLEAALWAFHAAANFQEAVLKAVNLGDDADTTGAVCGQLAGACWGVAGLPAEWLNGLARREELETAVRAITTE
jgi:ADP-ribosyl-[dinitrogen reductase] hydrolase